MCRWESVPVCIYLPMNRGWKMCHVPFARSLMHVVVQVPNMVSIQSLPWLFAARLQSSHLKLIVRQDCCMFIAGLL